MTEPIRRAAIATRGSNLALTQSRWVATRLEELHPGLTVEIRVVRTIGDRDQKSSLQAIGGTGAFTKEVQDLVLAGEADLAVHSLKDLPSVQVPGLRVGAFPVRADARDAWFGRDGIRFADLGPRPVVATGALRRESQVRHRYPEAVVEPIRGNVETRLRKFAEGKMDGMFLAAAGLSRLGILDRATELLDPGVFLPAPGQGVLAVEGRDEPAIQELLAPLTDPDTRDAARAERGFLAELEAGCQVPLGALARVDGNEVALDGFLASVDGTRMLRRSARGSRADAEALGRGLAREVREAGGAAILAELDSGP